MPGALWLSSSMTAHGGADRETFTFTGAVNAPARWNVHTGPCFFTRALKQERAVGTQELHRGRLIDHVQLVVEDLAASRRFYEAVLGVLGVPIDFEGDGFFSADELAISSADSEAAQGKPTGRNHLAFQAKDRATVDAFHKAGLEAGGQDNGAPDERTHYHPGYYAAFLLDPDGNNVEAVYHGEADRSADSVKISF